MTDTREAGNGRVLRCAQCSYPFGEYREEDEYPEDPICPNCVDLPRAYSRQEARNALDGTRDLGYTDDDEYYDEYDE